MKPNEVQAKLGEAPANGNGKRQSQVITFLAKYSVYLIFVLLVILSSLVSDVFFTERNLFNLLRQVSGLGIVSMGMLMVILTGGIDLSVGSMMAFGSVLSAKFLLDYPLPVAVLLTILIGAAMGAFSGVLVAARDMAPFVATLATMTIARGLAYIVSKGRPIPAVNQALDSFGNGYWMHIPKPVLLMLAVVVVTWILLRYTTFGRMIAAIGSNENAVRLAGIRVAGYKFATYVITGALASVAGIISTSRTGVGSPMVGSGLELDAIAAVVIGGAPLIGGRGNALHTLIGVLILGLIGNIMNLKDIPAYPQQVIMGLIIVAAVLMQGRQKS